jgi:hypothetical protein
VAFGGDAGEPFGLPVFAPGFIPDVVPSRMPWFGMELDGLVAALPFGVACAPA